MYPIRSTALKIPGRCWVFSRLCSITTGGTIRGLPPRIRHMNTGPTTKRITTATSSSRPHRGRCIRTRCAHILRRQLWTTTHGVPLLPITVASKVLHQNPPVNDANGLPEGAGCKDNRYTDYLRRPTLSYTMSYVEHEATTSATRRQQIHHTRAPRPPSGLGRGAKASQQQGSRTEAKSCQLFPSQQ